MTQGKTFQQITAQRNLGASQKGDVICAERVAGQTGTITFNPTLNMDTSPTLAGNLNVSSFTFNGHIVFKDVNNNEMLDTIAVGSAVNYISIYNQVTGQNPAIIAAGSDPNVGVEIGAAGTGINTIVSKSNTPLQFINGTTYQHNTLFSFATSTATRTLTIPDVTGTITVLGNSSSGSGVVILDTGATLTSPTLITPGLGTPVNGTLTNCTIPYTGLTGLGSGVSTALGLAVTGSGGIALATSPSFTTPVLGTPTSGTLTNCTGLPASSGISGLGTGVATALGNAVTGSGGIALATSPTFTTPVLGIPTSGTLTNCTGLPISTGVSGLGTGIATFLGTPSSANLNSALTTKTGTGNAVFATSPTMVTPTLGAASATSVTFSSTSGIIGSTTNDSAAAGSVGEEISGTATGVSVSNNTAFNCVTQGLTGGDWDVWGQIDFIAAGSTITTSVAASISTSSAALNAASLQTLMLNAPAGSQDYIMATPIRISLPAGTTNIFLVGASTFTTSTMTANGWFYARRHR